MDILRGLSGSAEVRFGDVTWTDGSDPGPQFFSAESSMTVGEIAAMTGAEPRAGADLDRRITNVAPIDLAGPDDLTFLDNFKFTGELATTRAGAVLISARFEPQAPAHLTVLRSREPYKAFVLVTQKFYRELAAAQFALWRSRRSGGRVGASDRKACGECHGRPGAVIGAGAEIGSGTIISANAVIGAGVRIGRDCASGRTARSSIRCWATA